jgi:hypothetical protein
VNQHVANGVTVVSHETFVNARPVVRSMVHVDEKQIASAPITPQIDAQPVRASLMGAGRPVSVRPPAAVENRRVVATRNPTPPPGPLDQRQAGQARAFSPGAAEPASREGVRTAPPENDRYIVPRPPNQADRQPNERARSVQATHPLVRTAPPVRERPEQQRNEQEKFNSWQRQRPTAPPQREERAPQSCGGDKPRH